VRLSDGGDDRQPEAEAVAVSRAVGAAALERPVTLTEVSPIAVRAAMRERGLSDGFIDGALAGTEFIRSGGNVVLTDDVREVLGREPRTYEQWARDHVQAFGGPGAAASE